MLVVFWGLSIDTSFDNFITFVFYAGLLNFVNVAQGYFCGVLTDSEEASKQINTFMILLFMLTSGGLGNVDAFPTFIRYISYLSP